MENNDINQAWNAVVPILGDFDFYTIKNIVGLAGFDTETLYGLGYDAFTCQNTSASQLVSEISGYFIGFPDGQKHRFLSITVEEILNNSNKLNFCPEERLKYYLNRLGWQLIDTKLLPIDIFDLSELKELDPAAQNEITKAAIRFRDGDLNGAITSACNAVENLIKITYDTHSDRLGEIDYSKSFVDRCKKALEATGVYDIIESQLTNIEWHEGSIKLFNSNLKGSINQAMYVLQLLRNNMSDVHATKPALKPLVFDCIKWAQIILRLLSGKYD